MLSPEISVSSDCKAVVFCGTGTAVSAVLAVVSKAIPPKLPFETVLSGISLTSRLLQEDRYRNCDYSCNGQLDEKGMKKYCALDRAGQAIMTEAYDRLGLSMRGYSKLLRIARTIADLEGSEIIREEHAAEALMYRLEL